MKIFLTILPLLLVLFGFLIYRFNGRKELLKIDLVQFLYAFVLTPVIFVCIKTFVFFNLKTEMGLNLDVEDSYFIDTALTVIFIYIYSFTVIHTLTKSFRIKKDKDPSHDVFIHAEYFHLWLSHVVTYSGLLLIMLFLAAVNLFYPLVELSKTSNVYAGAFLGIILGIVFYGMLWRWIWQYEVEGQARFDRVMKYQIIAYTLIMAVSYLVVRPTFSGPLSMYWCSALFFLTTAITSQVLRKSKRFKGVLRYAKSLFKLS